MTDLWNRCPEAYACAEPLEGRRLLSAPASRALPDVNAGAGGMHIISLALADDEHDDNEVSVAPSELPGEVAAALDARFPGARVIDAAFNTEDGGPEYGVSAVFNGRLIDVNLTPAGRIVETGEILTSIEIPAAVREWVTRSFPGARLGESAVVSRGDELNLELTITAAGPRDIEATLRLGRAGAPLVFSTDQAATGDDVMPPTPDGRSVVLGSVADAVDPAEGGAPLRLVLGEETQSPAREHPNTPDRSPPLRVTPDARALAVASAAPDTGFVAPPDVTSSGPANPAMIVADAIRAAISTPNAAAWLPAVAGALGDVLPADMSAVELGLRGVLGELDALTNGVTTEWSWRGVALRLAVAVGVFVGADLILRELRRARRRTVLVYDLATASWTWVPAPATPRGREAFAVEVRP
jgi:hypothetical protein